MSGWALLCEWSDLVVDVVEDHDVFGGVLNVHLCEHVLLLKLELDRVLQSMEPDVHYFLVPGCEQQLLTTRDLQVGVLFFHLPRLLGSGQDSDVLDAAEGHDLLRLLGAALLILVPNHGATVGIDDDVSFTQG